MKPMRFAGVAVLLLALLPAAGAFAQAKGARNLALGPADANEQRVALVIGNSGYKDAPLKNPVNDATDVAGALRELGFRVVLRTNANRRQMVEAVREFGGLLKKGGVGLFYYAGHGIQSKGRNFLVPVGAAMEAEADLEFESMDANMVLAQMEEARNRVNIVVLDACRNNPFARSFRSASRGLAQMEAATGSYLAYATAPGSVAADGDGRNGVFTKHLLASLREPETKVEDVFKRVRVAVARETGNKQIPWESSSLTGDFYFRAPNGAPPVTTTNTPAPATDPATMELAFWESVKDSKSTDEIGAYLEQYPNGKFAPLARARMKTLQSSPVQVAIAAPSTIVPETASNRSIRIGYADAGKIISAQRNSEPDQKKALDKANSALSAIAENYSLNMVLQEAVFSKSEVDITDALLEYLQNKTNRASRSFRQQNVQIRIAVMSASKIEREFEKARAGNKEFFAQINDAVRLVAERFQIDLILQDVAFTSEVADITDQVINQIKGEPLNVGIFQGLPNLGPKFGFIDADRINRESKPAKEASKRLESEFKSRDIELKDMQARGRAGTDEFRRMQATFKADLGRRRNEELQKLFATANTIIRSQAITGNFDYIVQEAVYRNSRIDITDTILGELARQ